jgi:nucleotidyltransferase/DNA polymerase involved in DNA repair
VACKNRRQLSVLAYEKRSSSVDRADEKRFLGPLPITLLPLAHFSLQQLDWLGIQTLQQFARLPTTAVWQRFGAEGKLAQKLAQRRDDRSVAPNTQALPEPISVDFDPPTTFHGHVLEAALRLLRPPLVQLAERLEGCHRLRVDLKFVEGSTRVIHCVFVDPVSDDSRLKAALSHQLEILNWPAALNSLRLTLLESAGRTVQQLALFSLDEKASTRMDIAQRGSFRHATSFFLPHLIDAHHPIAARRFTLNALSSVPTV